ncbi:MAG TPA: c-type cytochrome [Azospirillaceae bacterium]|nr:c-type cytochrome [Azospirillaceae bacterium]
MRIGPAILMSALLLAAPALADQPPAAAPGPAQAAVAPPEAPAVPETVVRATAGYCLLCHGPSGRDGAASPLAGRDPAAIAAAVAAFRDGRQHGTIMPRIAKGFDDATIRAVAAHLARTP